LTIDQAGFTINKAIAYYGAAFYVSDGAKLKIEGTNSITLGKPGIDHKFDES
jgi:hypothetical protein